MQHKLNHKAGTVKTKAVLPQMGVEPDADRVSGTKGKVLFIDSKLVATQ